MPPTTGVTITGRVIFIKKNYSLGIQENKYKRVILRFKRFYYAPLYFMYRHHHRHSNHHVSRNTNSSGGHSITVTTNRAHAGCTNHIASARAIMHPQLTPRTPSSSTASVSVSVTPRRSGGERIPNCNISGSSTASASISGSTSRDPESITVHSGHRKRAIRDARFPSNETEMDSERAPKRTTRIPVTIKRELTLQDEANVSAGNDGSSSVARGQKNKEQHTSDFSSMNLNINRLRQRTSKSQKRELPYSEACTVSSSTTNNVIEDNEMGDQESRDSDANNHNDTSFTEPPSTSSETPLTSFQSNPKGEPSKLVSLKVENLSSSSGVLGGKNQLNKTKKEDNDNNQTEKSDKHLERGSEERRQSFDANEDYSSVSSPIESPQPGPSGLQPFSSNEDQNDDDTSFAALQNAPDLQLDCLSSDTEDEVNEDVTVVKISRRRKGTSRKKWNTNGRVHNERGGSTTTINAPPGTVVEVDLTQESDTDDNEIHVDAIHPPPPLSGPHTSATYANHYSMDCVTADGNDDSPNRLGGGIKLRRFATAPHGALPPNVHSAGSSRGSTPNSTPGPSLHTAVPQSSSSNIPGNMRSTEGSSGAHNSDDRYYNMERLRMCNYSTTRPLPPPDANHSSCRSHRSYVMNTCNGECATCPTYHEPAPAHNPSNSTPQGNRQRSSSSSQPTGVSTSRTNHIRHLSHSRSSHHMDNTHSSRISNPSFDQWTFRPRRLRAPEGSIAPSASTGRSTSTVDGNGSRQPQQSLHHVNLHLQQQPHVPNDCPDAHCQLHQNPGSVIILGSPPREFHRSNSAQDANRQIGNTHQTLHRAHQSNIPVQQQTQPVDFRRSSSASRSSTDTTRESTETVAPTAVTVNRSREEVTDQSRNNAPPPQHISNHQPPPPPYPSDASDLLRPYHQIGLPQTASAFDPSSGNHVPRQDQRLLNAVWRMNQYHPLRSTRHPRHRNLWTSHHIQQEQMRRHMGSAAAAASNAPSNSNESVTNQPQPSIEIGTYVENLTSIHSSFISHWVFSLI